MQTDQLGLRGRCVLRRTARFLAPPTSDRPRFSAARVHALTAQLSVRHTGATERLLPDGRMADPLPDQLCPRGDPGQVGIEREVSDLEDRPAVN